jgi:hypothetical protein
MVANMEMNYAITYDINMTTKELKKMTYDQSIGNGMSAVSTYNVQDGKIELQESYLIDTIWGSSKQTIFYPFDWPIPRRIKYYQSLSATDFCKHINMRRKNIAQNRKGSKIFSWRASD